MGLGSFAGGMPRAERHEAAKMGTGHAMQSTPAEGPQAPGTVQTQKRAHPTPGQLIPGALSILADS